MRRHFLWEEKKSCSGEKESISRKIIFWFFLSSSSSPRFFSLDYHVVSLTKKNTGKAKPRGERVERDQMKKKEKKKKQPVLLLFIPGSFSFLRYLDSNE
uniref:Uncharacterized protein n=1 Tax=Saccharomyces cerevisiae TaxID=4932 RepID=A2P2F7_YEASX|nr:unknown [Saccharomyces cerevisiae]